MIKDFIKKNYKGIKRISFYRILIYAYFVIAFVFVIYHLYFANKVIKGIWIDDINLSGLNSQETVSKLISDLNPSKKVVVKIGKDYSYNIAPDDIKFQYLPVKTAKKTFSIGRSGNLFTESKIKLFGLFLKTQVEPEYKYDKYALQDLLENIKAEALDEVVEPEYKINGDNVAIKSGISGYTFDMHLAEQEIIDRIRGKNTSEIVLETTKVDPILTIEDLDVLKPSVEALIFRSFSITYGDKSWKLAPDDLIKLIIPQKQAGEVKLVVYDPTLVDILRNIAVEIDRNPRGQILEVKDLEVIKFISSEEGRKLRFKESAVKAKEALLSNSLLSVELVVDITNPPENNNEFGIKDLLGEGRSKFKGSIPSRIHNIELAASRVNGTLVPSGDVFSFNEAVGEINRSTGYTSAWVIDKGRTVLGDGGGVCQVSTTLFRAALNAGLSIVERNAHSYRVSYYEQESPVGIDATIYRPSVDLKFKNDTDGYLLITSEFNADEYSLTFRIYGKDDGRVVKMTEPKVLSKSAPPNTIYEEDPTLAKGVTRQVEHSVWGAKVTFSRVVSREGKTLYNDVFSSNYRPWPSVYKVGTKD